MCGFTDIRRDKKGSYYCSVCRRVFGKTFADMILIVNGKKAYRNLLAQCKQS